MFRLVIILLVATAFAANDDPKPKQIADDFFKALDADDDGSFVRADVDVYFAKYDEDNDTAVSAQEFEDYLTANRPDLADYADEAFQVFDTNSDGSLDTADFDAAMLAGEADGDGVVAKHEFDELFVPLFEAILTAEGGAA